MKSIALSNNHRTLLAMRMRLERAELAHLRRVVAEQGERIEALTARVEQLEADALDADRRADMFHDLWLAEQEGAPVGLTPAGEVVRMEEH